MPAPRINGQLPEVRARSCDVYRTFVDPGAAATLGSAVIAFQQSAEGSGFFTPITYGASGFSSPDITRAVLWRKQARPEHSNRPVISDELSSGDVSMSPPIATLLGYAERERQKPWLQGSSAIVMQVMGPGSSTLLHTDSVRNHTLCLSDGGVQRDEANRPWEIELHTGDLAVNYRGIPHQAGNTSYAPRATIVFQK